MGKGRLGEGVIIAYHTIWNKFLSPEGAVFLLFPFFLKYLTKEDYLDEYDQEQT